MDFQVPQFIEIEDKIVGPLTFKQFIYVAGGLGASFVVYKLLPLFLAIPIILVFLALSAALAFYKVNNRSFAVVLESALKYFLTSKLYLWRKSDKKTAKDDIKEEAKQVLYPTTDVPRLTTSKLKDLSWSLDINERIK